MPSLISLIYRTADLLKWGSGKGSNLTPTEFDNNNWTIAQAILAIQTAMPDATVGIDYFSISGDQMTVHMTDHSLRGPYTLPTYRWNFRGDWAPSTLYSIGDVITVDGAVYLVLWVHTSAATFVAGANDGLGHNYYGLLLTYPSNVLPTGGAAHQVLTKVDGHDFHTEWAYPIPVGGLAGEVLAKVSSTDFDTEWVQPDKVIELAVCFLDSVLAGGAYLFQHTVARAFILPANLTASKAYLRVAPTTQDVSVLIYKNATAIGSITWSISSPPDGFGGMAGTFTFAADVTLNVGDQLYITEDTATDDATAAGLSVSLMATAI